MFTVAQCLERISNLVAEAEGIQALCQAENREPKADESARLDAILGKGNEAGEIAKAKEEHVRAEKLEKFKSECLNRNNAGNRTPDEGQASNKKTIVVPLAAQRHGKLKAFKGQDAQRNAYAFGQWFLGMMGNEKSKSWATDHGYEFRNAMTEGLDSKGGFLVPEEFDNMIVDLRNDYGVARREFRVVPMGSDTKTWPRRTGGMTAYFPGEAGTITASDKTLDNIRLTAKKIAALGRFSSELNEDAVVSIGDDLASEIAYAFANKEDECAFNGTGASTYGGIVGIKNAIAAGSVKTAATGNTGFETLDLEDFEGMVAKMPSYGFRNGGPKWYIHRSGWAVSMLRLAAAAGGNTVREIGSGASEAQFLGYPVVFVEVMNNTLGAQTSTSGLCYFANLSLGTLFGDRRGVSLAQSQDVYFTTDELAIRGTQRFDINVHDIGTASAAGCIIGLTTPGS